MFPALVPSEPDVIVPHDRSGGQQWGRQDILLDFPEAIDSLLSRGSQLGQKCFELWDAKYKGDLRSAITGGQWPQSRLASVPTWTSDNLCQLCVGATGTLLHRHVCPAIWPSDGWQQPPRVADLIKSSLQPRRRELLITRGLFTLKVSVPCRPEGGTFQRLVRPLDDGSDLDATWFIDGSLFDEAKRYFRRVGFGIAVIGMDGSLIAYGHGVPPSWVWDAAGAELWAFYFVANENASLPLIVTDCKGIVDSLMLTPQDTTRHDRALGRTWAMIRSVLDDNFQLAIERVSWMPSHESVEAVGRLRDSQGRPITSVMWRANRLADALAKKAASEHRLPSHALHQVEAAAQLVRYNAAELEVVTHSANNHYVPIVDESGATVVKVVRDSTAQRPFKTRRDVGPSTLGAERLTAIASHGEIASNTDAQMTAPWLPTTGSGAPRNSLKRKASVSGMASRARSCKRAALAAKHLLREDVLEQEQLASWISTRELAPSAGPSAQERLDALRSRIRCRKADGSFLCYE